MEDFDMSVNIEGNISQINTGNNWFQNRKAGSQQEQEKAAPKPKVDNAVKVSISQEGIENYRKQLCESSINGVNDKVIAKGDKDSMIRQAKQATNALSANNYGNDLAKETEKLKEQRASSSTYSLSNRAEDSVRAYGNLYDEIVQGYQNGTRERYVEDKTSETGYRKMTMEEELKELDKAFQEAADEANIEKMIRGEFKRLLSKAGSKQADFSKPNKKPHIVEDAEETIGQKMKKLAQAWKDTYKTSGSKESGMKKVLSMLNGMFDISKKA